MKNYKPLSQTFPLLDNPCTLSNFSHFSFSVSVLWMTKFSSPNNVAASSFYYAIHFALQLLTS